MCFWNMATNAIAARSELDELCIPSNSFEGKAVLTILKRGQRRTRRRMVIIAGVLERSRIGNGRLETTLLVARGGLVDELAVIDGGDATSLGMTARRWVVLLDMLLATAALSARQYFLLVLYRRI